MQHIERYIDLEVWNKLPKEAQDILSSHHYHPLYKHRGNPTKASSTIVDSCAKNNKNLDDINTPIYI